MTRTVHVVEPGGRGGVHQHAAALATALAGAGVPVVLHSAADAEELPLPAAVVCSPCFWRFGKVTSRPLRRLAITATWLAACARLLLVHARAGDVVHVEGRMSPALFVPLAVGARIRRCTFGFSPHMTSSRYGRRTDDRLIRWLSRRADVVFALSAYDQRVMQAWGATPVRGSLLVGDWARRPEPALVEVWRRRWRTADRNVVLLAGQLRDDKGLDVAVEAASQWRGDAVLALVGEDLGGLAGAEALARRLGVEVVVDEGYRPLAEFAAAVAACDVVVCPYRVASMSAVLALAAALGRPTVASDAGGLAEAATAVVPPDDPGALAAAVDKVLAGAPAPSWPLDGDLVATYLAAYELG